jgi:phospholipid-translocating ATPase
LCEEWKVYKVYTYGNKYVVMGYYGRIDKNKRTAGVILDETHRVIQTGLEMIDTIKEIKQASQNEAYKHLDVKVGIHTGKVIAGIIGSKVVRYDIFGEGVVIANKIEQVSGAGTVSISEDTKMLI